MKPHTVTATLYTGTDFYNPAAGTSSQLNAAIMIMMNSMTRMTRARVWSESRFQVPSPRLPSQVAHGCILSLNVQVPVCSVDPQLEHGFIVASHSRLPRLFTPAESQAQAQRAY
eukprot:1307105-Rhodomonas_salina.5